MTPTEREAEAFADSKERRLTSYWKGLKDGYTQGAAQVDAYKASLRAKVMDISKYDEDLKMKVIELIDKTDLT